MKLTVWKKTKEFEGKKFNVYSAKDKNGEYYQVRETLNGKKLPTDKSIFVLDINNTDLSIGHKTYVDDIGELKPYNVIYIKNYNNVEEFIDTPVDENLFN